MGKLTDQPPFAGSEIQDEDIFWIEVYVSPGVFTDAKITGAQIKALLGSTSYSETFTPGTVAIANTITHDLNNTDLIITLWDVTTGEVIYADLDNRTTTTVDVTFDENPAGDVRIVIMSRGAVELNNRPYTVYSALLTQSGTNAPTAKVLENTLGVTPTLGYEGVGQYSITATGLYTVDKTMAIITPSKGSGIEHSLEIRRVTADKCRIHSATTATGVFDDDVLADTPVEIRVYN